MGKRGPAPKPTQLKKLAGNPGKRKLNEQEPQPERVVPAKPRGLAKGAQRFWDAHARKLEGLGIFTEVDGPAFAMMAIHYDIAWQAAHEIGKEGITAVDENGAARKHPSLQVLRDNSTLFLRYAAHFGLTPSARSNLKIPEPPAVDDYEVFLNG